MSEDPAPVERVPGTGAALSRGARAFLSIAVPAFILALANSIASGGMSASDVAKATAIYVGSFFRVGLTSFEFSAGEGIEVTLAVAPMLGTVLAVWLLFRTGQKVGAGLPLPRRLLRAAMAAGVCAGSVIAAAASSMLWPLDSVLGPVGATFPSVVLGPLLLCFVAALAGAAWWGLGERAGRRRRAAGALAGAWAMLAFGVTAAFLALVLLAAVAPGYSRVYLAGFRAAKADWGASAVANNAAFMPNEAAWALTASMGACAGIYGGDSDLNVDVVCRTRFPSGISDDAIDPGIEQVPAPRILEGVPLVLAIFALVAPAAVLMGGWTAARVTGADRLRTAPAAGASAGLLFAPLATATAWFSGADLTISGGELGIGHVFIGPRVGEVFVAALIWGTIGGSLGAFARMVWVRRRTGSGTGAEEVEVAEA